MAQPKTLAIVNQDFQRRRWPVAEHEDPAAERVVLQHLFADPGQAIDPFAKIGRLDGYHDPHLRRDLDHGAEFQKLRLSAARSGDREALQMDPHLCPAGVLQFQSAFASGHRGAGGANSRNVATVPPSARPAAADILLDPFLERRNS